jgi:protein-S-isoprenylcysteine O-methyltransferase Ste14
MVCVLGGGVPVIGNWILPLLGPVCLATGLGVLLVALNHMGSTNSLSPWPKPVDDGTLLTDGMFAQVRHPLYSSALLLCVGWSLVTDSATRLLLTALLWYVLEIKSNVEEDELLKKYPQQYADYQKQVTGKFLPNEFIHHLVSSVMSNKRE